MCEYTAIQVTARAELNHNVRIAWQCSSVSATLLARVGTQRPEMKHKTLETLLGNLHVMILFDPSCARMCTALQFNLHLQLCFQFSTNKFDFQLDAIFRDYLFRDGKWWNLLSYSKILKKEK